MFASGSWPYQVPEALGAGFPLSRLSLGSSQRCSLPIVILAHHWQASRLTFFGRETPKGMSMMRSATRPWANRIIDRPSVECGIFRREPVNDAVGGTFVCQPHH